MALPILGSVLTQLSGLPVFGLVLVLLSLWCLSFLAGRLTGSRLAGMVPAVLAFLFVAGFDYSLYVFRAQGLLFSQTLGLIATVGCLLVWKRMGNTGGRIASIVLIVLAGYPLVGAYAVLFALAAAVASLIRKEWLAAVAAVISGVLFPILFTNCIFTHIDTRYTFVAGLPYMDFVGNHIRFLPLALAGLSIVVLAAAKSWKSVSLAVSLPVTALMVACVAVFPYWNRNFHLEISMQQALEKNDWDKAVSLGARSQAPTRVIVMYRNIALLYKGWLCDRMFTYPQESVGIDTPAEISQTEVCAPAVFFYNGLINYSTRWAWEMSMMFQRTLERYKYQAKVALFTGRENPELVEKYLRIIGRNLYQKGWVRKYRSYLEDPSLLEKDPEYRMFRELDKFEEIKYMSSAVVENTVLNHYLLQENPQGVMLQESLAAAMTAKDIDMFWYYYDRLLDSGVKIPVHVGEAAILFAYIGRNQEEIDSVARDLGGPDSPIVRRFSKFSAEASSGKTEGFKQKYGDTYWYYCYFVKSITTD